MNSLKTLMKSLKEAPDSEITDLARCLINGARAMDLTTSQNLGVHPLYTIDDQLIVRDKANPVNFDHDSIIGAPGADDPQKPLKENERWHEGRRASHTGVRYKFNEAGLPINPFLKTGMQGRGLLWQYGPNHAVDNGVLVTRKNDAGVPTLYAIGIHRRDKKAVPALAGGFAKFDKTDNGYELSREAVIISCVEEMFEEMISGSVELLPEYAARVEADFDAEIARRMQTRTEPYDLDTLAEIREQIVTALKMEQVFDLDKGFMFRLRELVEQGRECYAGPVMNSNRATDNAWTETILSWVHLTDEKWNYIKGENPKFDYDFVAGDDADAVHYFKMDGDLIRNTNDSHAPLFVYMAASYLLAEQEKGTCIADSVLIQMQDIAMYLQGFLKPDSRLAPRVA